MINGSIILAGQLLGTAFSCGLNLYATVALLGLASRFGWIPALPPGMAGLQNGIVIGLAITLFVVQIVVDRIPLLGNAWEGVHTVIRPGAAAMLAFLALQHAPWYLIAAGCTAAAAMALAAHGTKAGLRLVLATHYAARPDVRRQEPRARTILALAEDTTAVAIALAALTFPELAPAIVGASLVLLLVGGPRLWRAATLGFRALVARTRGFFGGRSWRSRDQLPRYLRDAVPLEPLGRSPARATPAAINGMPRVGAYRNGWLVFTCDGPRFVYRSLLGARCTSLPAMADIRLHRGLMTDALYVTATGDAATRVFTIFLLKDGPPPQVAAAELTTS